MDQMLAMDCSEDESVDGCTRNEGWENEDGNQMDFEQESIDEAVDEAVTVCSPSEMEISNPKLSSTAIKTYEIQKLKYEEILKNQVENIVDLQSACEKVACIVDQLPVLKEQNLLRFNQVMSEMHNIKEKQRQLNDLIEFIVQIYDDNMMFIRAVKEDFFQQQKMNDERCIVFDMDVQQFPGIGDAMYTEIERRLKKKREYCWLLNNYLAEVVKSKCTSKELDMKIDEAFVVANDLNIQLLECESQLEMHRKDNVKLIGELQDEENEYAKKMEEIVKSEKECTETQAVLRQKTDQLHSQHQNILANNVQLKNEAADAEEKLCLLENELMDGETYPGKAEVRSERSAVDAEVGKGSGGVFPLLDCHQEKQEAASVRSSLATVLEELANQNKTLADSLSGLERSKQMIVAAEEEVKSLEIELEQQSMESQRLTEQCNEFEKRFVELESSVRESTRRIDGLEEENAKISLDVSALRTTVHRGRAELETAEKAMDDELRQAQSEVEQINQKLSERQGMFDECKNKFVALQRHNEAQRAIIKEKCSSIAQKEESMHSVNEELEECKVEFNDLIDQQKNTLELKNQVIQLENKLSNGRKELAMMNEDFSRHVAKMNEMNNKQIEEAMKEMESKNQEYVASLEEKKRETNALEEEFKGLQTTVATTSSMLKDASKQAELFACEQSLLSTFAKWVFDEGPSVPTPEPWVTSTSDNPLTSVAAGSELLNPNKSDDDDFIVKEIKPVLISKSTRRMSGAQNIK